MAERSEPHERLGHEGRIVTSHSERFVEVGGAPVRVWEKGDGDPIVFFAGFGGAPQWTPFMEAMSKRRRIVVPSLPGHPGAEGHDRLDSPLDWIVAIGDLLDRLDAGSADLMGVSVGASLAAEAAAMWPTSGGKLVLVAPLGIYRADQPVADFWAQSPGMLPELLCEDRSNYEDLYKAPAGEDLIELKVLETRASEAAARLFWPLADTGLDKRLHRIRHATMLIWGENDRVVPKSYADIYAALIPGHAKTMTVRGAGHLADLDAPQALATMVDGFLEETSRTRRDK